MHNNYTLCSVLNFVCAVGLDENSDGSLNTATVCSYADESGVEADLQSENKQ